MRASRVDVLVGLVFLYAVFGLEEGGGETNSAMIINANNIWYSRHTIIPVLLFHVAAPHCDTMVALATWTSRPRERDHRPRRTPLRISVRAGGRAAPA